jgi:hypothetical protein
MKPNGLLGRTRWAGIPRIIEEVAIDNWGIAGQQVVDRRRQGN